MGKSKSGHPEGRTRSDTLFMINIRCNEVHIRRGSRDPSLDPRVSEFLVQSAASHPESHGFESRWLTHFFDYKNILN